MRKNRIQLLPANTPKKVGKLMATVTGTQVAPLRAVAQYTLDGRERGDSHSDYGRLGITAGANSMKLRLLAATLDLHGGLCRLKQGGQEQDVTTTRLRAAPFALAGGLSTRVESKDHFSIYIGSRRVQDVNVQQVQLNHKAMVHIDAPTQSLKQLSKDGLDTCGDLESHALGVVLALVDDLKHCASTLVQDVAEDARDLHIAVFKDFLGPLSARSQYAHELPARTGERAQLLHRRGRHRADADQSVGVQVGQSDGVIDVGLAPGNVLDVCGVCQRQLKVPFQDAPHGLLVHAIGLQSDVLDAQGLQPVGQLKQAGGGGGITAHHLSQVSLVRKASTSHNGLLLLLSSRATRMKHFPRRSHFASISAYGPCHRTLKRALKDVMRGATVRGSREDRRPTDMRIRNTKYKPACVPHRSPQVHACFMRRGYLGHGMDN